MIVVAEGAGQDLMAATQATDASGNKRLSDIGVWLKDRISEDFQQRKLELNLKYIDPSYGIRSVPANPYDSVFCSRLAHNAVARSDVRQDGDGGQSLAYPIRACADVPRNS